MNGSRRGVVCVHSGILYNFSENVCYFQCQANLGGSFVIIKIMPGAIHDINIMDLKFKKNRSKRRSGRLSVILLCQDIYAV